MRTHLFSFEDMDQVQISQIGQQFVQSYYQTFDTNRAALVQLYVSCNVAPHVNMCLTVFFFQCEAARFTTIF